MRCLLFLILLFFQTLALGASKIDVLGGFFSLASQTPRGDSTISGLGSYAIAYRYQFLKQLDIQVGYSLLASKTFGGDLAFGPDLGLLYFPVTPTGTVRAKGENINVEWREHLQPYVGAGFHQRQYQSTQATFAGFSGQAGFDYYLRPRVLLRSDFRMIKLIGPSKATATEMDIMFGLSFELN